MQVSNAAPPAHHRARRWASRPVHWAICTARRESSRQEWTEASSIWHQGHVTPITATLSGRLEQWQGDGGRLGVDALTIDLKVLDIDGYDQHIDVRIEEARAMGEYLIAMSDQHSPVGALGA